MTRLILTLVLSFGSASAAWAVQQQETSPQEDDLLSRAKEQYEAAAYEEALSTLDRASEAPPLERTQVEQYRALCLIALGRHDEADRTITALVAADPSYVPPGTVASPRVLTLVSEIRKRELPGVIRRLMEEGRAAYQRKDHAAAREDFALVLRLVDDPAMRERAEVADLKVVASGYIDLASAAPSPAAVPPPAAPEPAKSEPAAATPAPEPVVSVPAAPIRQNMPPWQPRRAFAELEYNGLLRLRIGADGRVKTVNIEKPSHPEYDQRLLEVAPTWLYKPATHNGIAIESEKLITVRLQPIPNP